MTRRDSIDVDQELLEAEEHLHRAARGMGDEGIDTLTRRGVRDAIEGVRSIRLLVREERLSVSS